MSWIATSEADIETIIQLESPVVEEHHAASQSAKRDRPFQPAAPTSTPLPKQDKLFLQRNRAPIVAGVIAIAAVGSAFAWWAVGLRQAEVASKPPVTASAPARMPTVAATPSAKVEPAPIPPVEDAVGTAETQVDSRSDVRKTRERSAKLDRAKIRNESILKRRADNEAARKADVARAARSDNVVHIRSLPSTKADLPRPAKLRPVFQTPQQACADRSNFISRGICESRECEKPERASLKFCIDMHERRAPQY